MDVHKESEDSLAGDKRLRGREGGEQWWVGDKVLDSWLKLNG